MGVDLTLMICNSRMDDTWGFAHTMLELERDSHLWKAIRNASISLSPVPKEFSTFKCRDDQWDDNHYGNTQEDAYGDSFMYTRAGELCRVMNAFAESQEGGEFNEPAIAYLRALDPTHKIALYWH